LRIEIRKNSPTDQKCFILVHKYENYDYIAVLSYQVRLDELVLVAITTRHDARPNPLFRSVLPVGATGIDLIERIQLPSDSLYPMDYLVTSSLEANDYRSRLNRRFCVPPRTPNGSYLVPEAIFPHEQSSHHTLSPNDDEFDDEKHLSSAGNIRQRRAWSSYRCGGAGCEGRRGLLYTKCLR
jgi:hypothetical protein